MALGRRHRDAETTEEYRIRGKTHTEAQRRGGIQSEGKDSNGGTTSAEFTE